ncbi:hypothetical protein [Hymenobacter properus]|uniref:Uncharacterized protein n=1 Tax=Hymenobacter properus TaxID=2791026 RepID=A0A931FLN6_9BACT|nr:hypothetical protein [Hymenobacter properus]MBF9140864.1 hypothetical protein [Hymenobacter properus]MBR7719673.1 hypothetical protein [Microvirga sp. SRT04]
MKHSVFLLFVVLFTSCAGFREAQQRRRVAKAEQVLATYKRDTPPDQQLTNLVAAHPELEGKTVRVVTKTDTLRVPGATVTVTLPAVSTAATDNALVDSLMRSAASQLHAKDSLAYAARLRAILAARPKLSRDTLVQRLGVLTVRTWVDRQGRPHTTVTSAPQKFGYAKEVHETGPVVVRKEMTTWERIWLFIKDASLLLVLLIVGGVVLVIAVVARRRRKEPAA